MYDPEVNQQIANNTQQASESELFRVRRVDGFKVPLGSMPQDELLGVYTQCQERVAQAIGDLNVVGDYLQKRFPIEEQYGTRRG